MISEPRDSLHVDSTIVRNNAQASSLMNESRSPILPLQVDLSPLPDNSQDSSGRTQANLGGSSSINIAACWTVVLQGATWICTTDQSSGFLSLFSTHLCPYRTRDISILICSESVRS